MVDSAFRRGEQAVRPHEELTCTTHISENGRLSCVVDFAVVPGGKALAQGRGCGANTSRGLRVLQRGTTAPGASQTRTPLATDAGNAHQPPHPRGVAAVSEVLSHKRHKRHKTEQVFRKAFLIPLLPPAVHLSCLVPFVLLVPLCGLAVEFVDQQAVAVVDDVALYLQGGGEFAAVDGELVRQ